MIHRTPRTTPPARRLTRWLTTNSIAPKSVPGSPATNSFVINPFVSKDQRAACYAKDDPNWDCDEWQKKTGKRKLPKRKRPTTNAKRRPNPLKYDPTRTGGLRRAFMASIRRRFALLKGRLYQLVVVQDSFGLKSGPTMNAGVDQPRDEKGQWTSEGGVGGFPLSSQEKAHVLKYTFGHTDVHDIHMTLRSSQGDKAASVKELAKDAFFNPGRLEYVSKLDSAIDKHRTEEPKTVLRGVTKDILRQIKFLKPGQVLWDKSYKSVTTSKEVAKQFGENGGAVVQINIPKGARALPVSRAATAHAGQEEYILPRDSELVYKGKAGNKHVFDVRDPKMKNPTMNAFCPTGEGGGQDNSCSPVAVGFGDSLKGTRYEHAPAQKVTDAQAAKVKQQLESQGRLNLDGTLSLYHDTVDDPEVVDSILKEGFIPAKMKAPGQDWKAAHSDYATYFHQDKGAARGLLDTAGEEFVTTVEARIPINKHTLSRLIPDEESGAVHEGIKQLISGNGAFAMIGGVPKEYLHHSSKPAAEPSSPPPSPPAVKSVSSTASPASPYIADKLSVGAKVKYKGKVAKVFNPKKIGTTGEVGIEHRDGSIKYVPWHTLTWNVEITTNADWKNSEPSVKVKSFQAWLEQQQKELLTGAAEEQMWSNYVAEGFKRGAGRAFDDVKPATKLAGKKGMDFYKGTREEFLRSSFGQPEAIEKVKLLAGRSFDELEGVTADMSLKMSRTLTDGLVQGKNPREVASDLVKVLDISDTRAEVIARTEIIRAHAEGQLTAMENLGVTEVGVAVEWSTAGDDRVCEECEPLEGVVMKIEEARGMLPRHPNCRCAWIPANVGEDKDDQLRSKGLIDKAIIKSRGGDEEDDWGPAGGSVSKSRPKGLVGNSPLDRLDELLLINAFCPTGEGGGQDDSGGSSSGSNGVPRLAVAQIKTAMNELFKTTRDPRNGGDCGAVARALEMSNPKFKVYAIISNPPSMGAGYGIDHLMVSDDGGKTFVDGQGVRSAKQAMGKHDPKDQAKIVPAEYIKDKKSRYGGYYKAQGSEEKFDASPDTEVVKKLATKAKKPTANAFCPTGPGGGQDNSCSPGGGGGGFSVKELTAGLLPASSHIAKLIDENMSTGDWVKTSQVQEELTKFGSHLLPSDVLADLRDAGIIDKNDYVYAQTQYGKAKGGLTNPSKDYFPKLENLTVEKTLPGSNGAKLTKDSVTGEQFVLKDVPHKQDQLKNEVDADNAYRALGVKVPQSGLIESGDGVAKVGLFIKDGETLADWKVGKSNAEIHAMHKQIGQNFVADALMANWDVAGLTNDNILIDKTGLAYRIDNGGALKYRAQGTPKGDKFGPKVGELDTLINADMNPTSAAIFKHLTDADIHQQIKQVLSKKDAVLNAIKDPETKAIMEKRFGYLAGKVNDAPTIVKDAKGGTVQLDKAGNVISSTGPAKPPASVGKAVHQGVAVGGGGKMEVGAGSALMKTPHGLESHIKANQGDAKFTQLHLDKIKYLNPNGIKDNTFITPQTANAESDAKQLAQLKKILPAGTVIKKVDVKGHELAIAMKSGQAAHLNFKSGHVTSHLKDEGVTFSFDESKTVSTPATKSASFGSDYPSKFQKYLPQPVNGVIKQPNQGSEYDETANKKWAKSLTHAEGNAVSSWKGSAHSIRKSVASGSPNAEAKAFMSALAKSPPHVGVTFRGLSGSFAGKLGTEFEKIGVGGTWSENAPRCTSKNFATAQNFSHGGGLIMRIQNKTARPIVAAHNFSSEEEITGMPGVKYKVVGIHKSVKVNTTSGGYGGSHYGHIIDLQEI